MSHIESTVNPQEVNKFAQHAALWWDPNGPLKTLHDINGVRLDFIMQYVQLKDIRVLDVGCGGGILCEAMTYAGAKVTGIDAACEAISVAQKHALDSRLDIDYLCSSIEHYKNHTFDVVTCMELLEHVDNPVLILQHCRRLLKPNGLLFVSTINRTLKAYATAIIAAEYVLNILPRQTHDYDKFIKPSELLAMARSYDFSLIEMKGIEYNPFLRQAVLGKDLKVNYLLAMQ